VARPWDGSKPVYRIFPPQPVLYQILALRKRAISQAL
jgi:hypothetical protein